ncbi:unannotated protein [freshwater metagenome]|uniref:Unannotated protein n=1 Tax=freshwater metagenome TaxID=449393 RepID=A0A6J7A8Q0_9ZZZZ
MLSPFDPVCWNRSRSERLFNFHYRIEIYTPAHRRVYGYYVLPVLCGDSLVGRVDLEADRQNSTLLVHAAYAEPGVATDAVALRVVAELPSMAAWLGLERVEISDRGDLASPLRLVAGHYARP